MNRPFHFIVALAVVSLAGGTGASAQVTTAPATATASKDASDAQSLAAAEAVRRDAVALDNARKEVRRLRTELALRNELIELGRTRNAELYEVAQAMLDRLMKNKSYDPFFQTGRVRMENLKQEYEDKLRAARIYEHTLPPSVQKRMDADLARQREAAEAKQQQQQQQQATDPATKPAPPSTPQ
ncbi:hypothetical protein [Pseudonocardia sp. TMWB2A]|uniref:hypothetical protein n=1 Tax=Pseudonocardia sp. TMWB2A TaxID=687430 RepID=UPI00307E7E89